MTYAEAISLITTILAISASSLRTGEALVILILLSLELWGRMYATGSWFAASLLSQ
jgi:hypothetical protein